MITVPDRPPVGNTRLHYDHGIYTVLNDRDYFVVQCFSRGSLVRQLTKMRLANRERVYYTTDPDVS